MKKETPIIGIYKITSPSGSIYIGQSFHIKRRWRQYLALRNCKLQPKLYSSFQKYGVNNHSFEVVCECPKDELNNKEIYYIELYQSFNTKKGMNLRTGGDQRMFSNETILKMKKSHTGVKLSDYHRKRQGDGQRGEKHYLFGKHRSEETKEKLRQARLKQACPRLGKKHTPETKAVIKLKKIGTVLSVEHKNKIGNSLKGRIVTDETRNKIRMALKGRPFSEERRKNIGEGARNGWRKRNLRLKENLIPIKYNEEVLV